MDWGPFLEGVFGVAVGSGIVGTLSAIAAKTWIERKVGERFERALENHRAKLRVDASAHEVRFQRLHDLRIEAIVELYRRIIRARREIGQLAFLRMLSDTAEVPDGLSDSVVELRRHYEDRALFFPAAIRSAVETFLTTAQRAAGDAGITAFRGTMGKKLVEDATMRLVAASQELGKANSEIERRFQDLLGVDA